jgi:hypothetical protein
MIQKSLSYPIYKAGTNLDAHVRVFRKAINANGEKDDANIINLFCFTLHDTILEWGDNFFCGVGKCFLETIKKSFKQMKSIWH